ncbi:amidase [Aliiglaciecola sp. LCG003]|uniref:amidase n=1 Tax=Aliiglaciecola sp. LCG003 TaxID=3053655 RepID=UPI002572CE54|nr:amidase [Aliiglaciecola sp. LCG003]WJG07591.1 amidase [Aliiglaciecola sp. LCG003]
METSFNSPFLVEFDPKQNHSSKLALSGMTVAIKDLFDIKGLVTGAGNPAWQATHLPSNSTAPAVTSLENAGARLLGKTITDELAYSLNGQNVHYPALLNCLSDERFCGGSTSGSAVAVGRSLADVGLGTDTGGSIRVPASYNGLVGFRPTHSAVDNSGVVPLAPSFDTVGWITSTIDQSILVANELVSNTTNAEDKLSTPVVLSALASLCDFEQEFLDWCATRLPNTPIYSDIISEQKCTIASHAFRVLQGREIWQVHGDWITTHQADFGADIDARFSWCQTLNKEQELQACDQQQRFLADVKNLLQDGQYLVMPTTPGPAPLLNCDADELASYRNKLMMFTCIAGLSGCPQIHLPVFKHSDQAYGISLLGPRGSDLALLALAKSIMDKHNED